MSKKQETRKIEMDLVANENGVFQVTLDDLAESAGLSADQIKVKRPKKTRLVPFTGDVEKDSKMLAKAIVGDVVASLNRFRVFKNGKKTVDGKEFTVSLTQARADYIGGKIDAAWKSVRQEIMNGVSADAFSDMP